MNPPIEMLSLWVPGTPVPQGSKRAWYNAKTKHVHMAEAAGSRHSTWRAEVRGAALDALDVFVANWVPLTDGVSVALTFFQHHPGSHYGSGRNAQTLKPNAPVFPIKAPDVDKLVRAVLDSLTDARVWVDDAQVVALTARKRYCNRWTESEGVSIKIGVFQ